MANHLETREAAYRDTIQGGRLKLFALLLVCAAPVIASYVTFYIVKPEQRSNYGELARVAPLPDTTFTLLDGKPFRLSQFKGQWVLVTFDGGACADTCLKKLHNMRQVRTALGRERERIERVWLITDDAPLATMTMREYDGTRMLRTGASAAPGATAAPGASALAGASALPGAIAAAFAPGEKAWRAALGATLNDHIYLIDPLGNLVLRFPKNEEPGRMKKDLDRLLKYSRIG